MSNTHQMRQQRGPPNFLNRATSLDAIIGATSLDLIQLEPDHLAPAFVCANDGRVLTPTRQISHMEESPERESSDIARQLWPSSTGSFHASAGDEGNGTRSARSNSSASRKAHRLSLTIPIAPASPLPSRPPPCASVPPTPAESIGSVILSPDDPSDMISAIASQEQRVLDLREELARAETDLKKLRRKWMAVEAGRLQATMGGNSESLPLRNIAPIKTCPDSPGLRQTDDMQRRKAMLLAQQAPRETKRTVIRGGHTRALSLLSPVKSSHGEPLFSDGDSVRSAGLPARLPNLGAPTLSKRATWTPRQSEQPHAVKQMAQELKQGLWTFVEDLRQATVGDEGISATSNRTSEFGPRMTRGEMDQSTIRASSAQRGAIPFTDMPSELETPTKQLESFQDRAQHRRSVSRPELKTRKHWSWTPLTFDDCGDDDWSNWDSPNVKTARWSGSTVSGDIIPAIPERNDENEGTLRRKRSRSELRPSGPYAPSKLGELPSTILNSLNPNNIKRMSSEFIKEWEKSLSSPENGHFDRKYQTVNDTAL